MWKVLLADDEEVILSGIRKMIEWEKFEAEIVGEAHDGEEALELVQRHQPDIVISDVKMPGMTGLELLEEIRKSQPETQMIFISAYQEFDYVKFAISKGAVDYLLKPVRRRDLEQVLHKTIEQLRDRTMVSYLKTEEPKDGIEVIFRHLNDGYEYAEEELYKEFSRSNLDMTNKSFMGICYGFLDDESTRNVSYEKYKLIKFAVYNKIQEMYKKDNCGFVIRKDDNCCNLMAVFPDGRRETFMEEVVKRVKEEIEQEYGMPLCVGIGQPVKETMEINHSFNSARHAYELYYFEKQDVIDYCAIEPPKEANVEEVNELSEKVFADIAAKDEGLTDSIRDVLSAIGRMHYGNRNATVNRCLIFTGNLLERLQSYDMVKGSFVERQEALLEAMESKHTYWDLVAFLLDYYEKLMPEVYKNARNKDVAVIVKVKEYLNENYMNDISLKELADMACVSPSYFSTFFKNTTGENYKSYLIKIRMQEAIRLVMNTDLKTYEIAEQVGYNNVRRFVDAFKGKYRMSPMDYRKLYKKKV
jgi:two-component system response regulator YesN